MHNLLIDRGNTRIKIGLSEFGSTEIFDIQVLNNLSELESALKNLGLISRCIYSDVKKQNSEIERLLSEFNIDSLRCDHQIKLPFSLDYDTPETLGDDRIAAIANAFHSNPNQNTLVIDSGTCITYDYIDSSGIYKGGAISPGIEMRYKAMHEQTFSLPKIEFDSYSEFFPGKSTMQSMKVGVNNSVLAEAQNFIDEISNKHGQLNVLLGGGDRKFFESNLKGDIFARENLILEGLNSILLFHDSEK